jgi:hypothetical protein
VKLITKLTRATFSFWFSTANRRGNTMDRSLELFERIKEQGELSINDFIEARASEELFLDFKRSANNGDSRRLHQTDRNNLAKAISGFGNSSGGIIVWGVDCSEDHDGADVAKCKVPIQNVERFLSNLQGVVSGCTIPVHNAVEHFAVPIGDGEEGFVVTYIPSSLNSPHQAINGLRYYIRAGSDFLPAPHQVLAGMFGRRPQPRIYQMFSTSRLMHQGRKLVFECGFTFTNDGPGIARDLFLTALTTETFGENCRASWAFLGESNWSSTLGYGIQFSLISNESIRLPPKAFRTPIKLRLEIEPPFTEGLKIKCNMGCSESPTTNFDIENSAEEITQIYHSYFAHLAEGDLSDPLLFELARRLLNAPANGG